MNQQDWTEYFEMINGRKPTSDEAAKALMAGEWQLGETTVNKNAVNVDTKNQVNETTMTSVAQSQPKQSSEIKIPAQVSETAIVVKKNATNYFVWLKNNALRPTKAVDILEKEDVTFSIVTFVLSVAFAILSVLVLINRVLGNISKTIGMAASASSTFLDQLEKLRSNLFGAVAFRTVMMFLVGYLLWAVVVAIANRNFGSMKNNVLLYFKGSTASFVFNFLAFLVAFIVPLPTISLSELSSSNYSSLISLLQQAGTMLAIMIILLGVAAMLQQIYTVILIDRTRVNQKFDNLWVIVLGLVLAAIVSSWFNSMMFRGMGESITTIVQNWGHSF